jgi:hypothetical protein
VKRLNIALLKELINSNGMAGAINILPLKGLRNAEARGSRLTRTVGITQ